MNYFLVFFFLSVRVCFCFFSLLFFVHSHNQYRDAARNSFIFQVFDTPAVEIRQADIGLMLRQLYINPEEACQPDAAAGGDEGVGEEGKALKEKA